MLYIFLGLLILPPAEGFQFTSSYGGQTMFAVSGSSVTFHWSISGDVGTVNWGIRTPNKNDITTLVSLDQSGMVPFSPPPPNNYIKRVNGSFNGDSVSGSANYILSGITKSDEREYGCQARSSDYTASLFDIVKLVVVETPHITLSHNTNTSYNEGSEVDIRCNATGSPEPDVMWTHNGHVLSSGSKTAGLSFNAIRRVQAGMYTCKANNSVGSKQKSLTLIVNYPPAITTFPRLTIKSWIGQSVSLVCAANGHPTPTITWKKPNGSKLNEVTATQNKADAEMIADQDFGSYTCEAKNVVGAAATRKVEIKQIKAPSSPDIVSADKDIQATSLTVKWTAPTDNGGSPITAYRVVILQGENVIMNVNITDPAVREISKGHLKRNTNYNVKVYARNDVFEGDAIQKTLTTKVEGVPLAADIIDLPAETKTVQVKIKWNEPQNNGVPITQYTVYQRTVKDDGTVSPWNKIKDTSKVSERQVIVRLEKGKNYEFVVTAANKFGESFKEADKVKKIKVLGDVPMAVKQKEIMYADVTLTWDEPANNGADITQYYIYQRIAGDDQWKRLAVLTDLLKREYVVEVEKDKGYEFAVTAGNIYGESSKDNIETVKLSEVLKPPPEAQAASLFKKEKLLHAIYISVIVVLLATVFALVVVLCRLRKPRLETQHTEGIRKTKAVEELIPMTPLENEEEAAAPPLVEEQKSEEPNYELPGGGDYMPLHPSTRSWEISREQVNVIKIIGKGAFSEVAQATVWDLRNNQKNITVAAKMLKANAPASDRKDLLSELELMTKLKPHAHVIKLIGCVTESDPLLVLIEYVPFGDLLGYLRKSRGLNDTYFKDPDVKPQTSLTAGQLMKFAWQVADGMCYLSSKKIIHRDLAARNVLVGEGEKCKVTDFWMARNLHQDDIYSKKSRSRLPVKWTAYEALLFGIYTTQSDVWSYGILLYEIITVGGSPYPDINPRQIPQKLQEGYRMPKPNHVDSKLYEIMLKCWEEQPTDRPTFEKLRKNMKEMEKHHKTYVSLSQYDNSLYANVKDLADE